MTHTYKVYILSHPQHGSYIGVTKRPLEVRLGEIIRDKRNDKVCKLRAAIKESEGFDWTMELLEDVNASNLGEARVFERKYINQIKPNLNERVPPKKSKSKGVFIPTKCHN